MPAQLLLYLWPALVHHIPMMLFTDASDPSLALLALLSLCKTLHCLTYFPFALGCSSSHLCQAFSYRPGAKKCFLRLRSAFSSLLSLGLALGALTDMFGDPTATTYA